MTRQTISKSTIRRRFLEEVEVVDLYRVNAIESNSQFSQFDENINNTRLYEIPNVGSASSGSSNNDMSTTKYVPSTLEVILDTVGSYLNFQIVDLALNISESDNEMSSDGEAPGSFLNLFKDNNCIINKIFQWAFMGDSVFRQNDPSLLSLWSSSAKKLIHFFFENP